MFFIQISPTKITLEMFFSLFPDLRQRNWQAGSPEIGSYYISGNFLQQKQEKNFKGVLFSFCAEEKYNTEVAVISTKTKTKTMNNSGHLTFLLTQQV